MEKPGSPSKLGKALNQHISPNPDRLQIRIVPYSPPRLSTESSASSCPVSCVAYSPSVLTSAQGAHDGGYAVAHSSNPIAGSSCQTPLGADLNFSEGGISADFANVNVLHSSPAEESPSRAPGSPLPQYRRAKRIISVNSDKTFNLLPREKLSSFAIDSTRSPRVSSTAPSSSIHTSVSKTLADEQPSSSQTTLQLSRPSSENCTPLPASKGQLEESSSPWNYQFIGGLRKVPESASQKTFQRFRDAAFPAGSRLGHESSASGFSTSGPNRAGKLTPKQSFRSYQSTSTLSEMNYKTFTHDSPCPKQTNRFEMLDKVETDQIFGHWARCAKLTFMLEKRIFQGESRGCSIASWKGANSGSNQPLKKGVARLYQDTVPDLNLQRFCRRFRRQRDHLDSIWRHFTTFDPTKNFHQLWQHVYEINKSSTECGAIYRSLGE
ncbi:hypothetical protein E4U41_002320 [Claviceps citrina]|nr:hypothetical protein E4U41_002320 [Claviceps citrina]